MRTKKKVDLKRLAAALTDYPFAYLITVDDGYRVHTVTVEPTLRDATIDVGLIGGRTRNNLAQRRDVTLLWPPTEPGGYSLIVDGHAETTDSEGETAWLSVVPTRALLHRDADPDSPEAAKGCLHDCVVFTETA
ncbi:MAG: pyridoxamine 5'-phosphate oxidase family protein [Mycobacterium sp.]|uniref:pyridoxamine 5'-phosphate oxidase family protein n=1 Tax=Mycobacterium sp. TaxID=1785 RepID=UPI003F9AAB44